MTLLARAIGAGSVQGGRRIALPPDPVGFTPPYSVPTLVNTSRTVNVNTVDDIAPPGWAGTQPYWERTLFNAWGAGVFVKKWGVAGGYVLSNCGGHGDGPNLGIVIWDVADAAWKYFYNANGIYSSGTVRTSAYAPGETSGAPWWEIPGATQGEMPVTPHVYNTMVPTDDGDMGTVMFVGRGALTNNTPSFSSFSCHYQDLSTRIWRRRASNLAAYPSTSGMYDGSSCEDPTAGRYYYAPINYPNQNNYLAYVDRADWTWKTTPTWPSSPPVGDGILFCADSKRMLIWHVNTSFYGLDLTDNNSIDNGWTLLQTTGGSVPSSGKNNWVWHPTNGKFYRKNTASGDVLTSLQPPSGSGMGGQWTMGSVTISETSPSVGLPDQHNDFWNDHFSRLQYVPSLDLLMWIAHGRSNGVTLVKV